MAVKARVVDVEVDVSGSSLSSYEFRVTVKFSDDGIELGEGVFREQAYDHPQATQVTLIVQELAKQILQRRNELQASRNAVQALVPEIKRGIESLL